MLAAGGVAVATVASLAIGTNAAHATLAPGTPLKTLAMQNGSRYFGSDMTGNLLSQSTVTQLQAQQFNMVTPGNEMKWDTTEPSNGTFNFAPGDQIVAYAQANNERVRCHNLVWQSQLPSWVSSLPSSQVQAAMETHITTEATHFKGECYAWDVVNEPFNSDGSFVADPFFNAMGSAYIADALRTAHAADPNAKLYLNDFNIEGMNAKSNAMFSLAQSLLAAGVPLNGIGFESHFILGGIPSDMQANMQRFANLGLDVAVTELDDRITLPASAANLAQQATEFAQVVKDCLGVTRCVGVTQWAVGDADSWVPGTFSGQGAATMFDQNYNPKPAFTAVQTALGGTQNTITVTNPGTQSGTVGTAVSLQIHATDSASGQTLSYAATPLPAGLSINSSTGLISGTPTASGSTSTTVTVTDTTGAAGTASFSWNIGGVGQNTITVTNPGTQSGTVGTAVSLQIHATDSASGQTLSYAATPLPAGLSINSSTGLISGTPTASGSTSTTVTVKDTTGATGTASFTWNISTTGGGTCHVTYTRNSEWPGGFTAQVVIANTGKTAISSWSLTFTFPGDQKVTNNFNGGFSQTGEAVTLTNASYNGAIAAGASVTDGFQGTWTSNDTNPSSFSVNGTACN
jgi:endo-1,4-beta-xylanase